jgi:transcriptional repressor NrdR
MRCPYCHADKDRVVDSRTSQEGRAVRRRRECLECSRRFTTYEVVEDRQLQIHKRDGSSEAFDRHKLLQSIRLSCVKRPVAASEIESMADEIEEALSRLAADDVESRVIGELVMDRLKARDYVAYVRYASVYRNFQDLDEFYEELRELSARRARSALNQTQVELPLNDAG